MIDSQPALERVQRSVRNVDAAIRDRQQTVDDLARRIGSIRLAKLGRSREGSVAPSSIRREQPASPSQSTISPSRISFDTPDDVVADVEAILDRDSSRIQNRIKGMKIARLTQGGTKPGSKGYLAHASLANGPIMIDALPLPGSLPIVDVKPDISGASVKSTVPQPERDLMLTTNGTASAFGGIKLSLEAGDLASTQSSRTSRSSTTHRTHTAAAKLGSSPRSGAPPTSSMSFTLPNAASPAPTGAPAGFFR